MSATRARILEAAGELFARQGYVGTGMNQIVSEGGAALGSIYHFFPRGKAQLCAESIRRSGELYLALIEGLLGGADNIVEGVRDFFLGAGEHLVLTGYADACPIATIALEVASTDEELRQATADVFCFTSRCSRCACVLSSAARSPSAGWPSTASPSRCSIRGSTL